MSAVTPHLRWVLDTNIVVAGLLWDGPPRRLLDCAIDGQATLISSAVLLDELAHTLGYAKFERRIIQAHTSISALLAQYASLSTIVRPDTTPRIVPRDPDDDHVIACAITARAHAIVSGDHHLLELGSHHGIAILTAVQALARI